MSNRSLTIRVSINPVAEKVLEVLKESRPVVIDTTRCTSPEEEEFEIYSELLRQGRTEEKAKELAHKMVWGE